MVAAIDPAVCGDGLPAFRWPMFSRAAERLWTCWSTARPDLIILDYYTPLHGWDGVCRPPPRHGTVPPPSSWSPPPTTGRSSRASCPRGVLDYLVKPFAFARFRQAMDNSFRHRICSPAPQESSLLDQQAIDRLIRRQEHPSRAGTRLSKGLNAATLERVRSFLSASRGQALTSEEIAEQVHLSRITIRRYVNVYGGDRGAGQLHRLPDWRPALHPLQLHRADL